MATMEFDQSLRHDLSTHNAVPRPAIGWKKVLLQTFKEIGDDRVTLIAGGVTYFLLLSLFPSVTAFSSVVKAMFEAMNVAYDETEKRNFFALYAVALCFTLVGVVAAAVMLAVVVAIPALL